MAFSRPASVKGYIRSLTSCFIPPTADVCPKEKRPPLIAPRETPLSTIHLRNLLTPAEAGAHIVPDMPGFYVKPETVDDMVNHIAGKALDAMGIEHNLYPRWKERGDLAGMER